MPESKNPILPPQRAGVIQVDNNLCLTCRECEVACSLYHEGECNPALAASPPTLIEKSYPFGDVDNPVMLRFGLKAGPATLANLAPGPDDSYCLIAAPVEVVERGPVAGVPDSPHFWVRPDRPAEDFLRGYSEAGGTHHLALLRGDHVRALELMARLLGVEFVVV